LPEQIRQKRLPNIAQYHTKNMLNVEEAIKDALRRTIKIEDVGIYRFLKGNRGGTLTYKLCCM
jgi:hypothetical protein